MTLARWNWDVPWMPVMDEARHDLEQELYALAELKWLEDRLHIARVTGSSWNATMAERRLQRIRVLELHVASVRRNLGVTRGQGRLCGWVEEWPAPLMPHLFELTEHQYAGVFE